MNFGDAWSRLLGKEMPSIRREGWHGQNMRVELSSVQLSHKLKNKTEVVPVLFLPDGESVSIWHPSTADLLAEDWMSP